MSFVRKELVWIQLPLLNIQVFRYKDLFVFENFDKTENNIINAKAEKVLW